MHARTLAAAGASLICLLAPASAHAQPALEPLEPCYVTAGTAKNPQAEAVRLRATGFTPHARVDLSLNGTPVPSGTSQQVAPDGSVEVPEFPAPFIASGTSDFTVTLTEQGSQLSVTATSKTSALGVSVRPRRARPSQRIRFEGLGFTAEKPVYAHYIRRGRQQARVRMVGKTGECGAWQVRRRQFPMRSPSQGDWIIQFDQSRRFHRPSSGRLDSVFVRLGINVRLVPE